MLVLYSDPFEFPLPPEHRFPLAKYRLLRERLLQWPAHAGIELRLAPRATREELLLVHAADYVDGFLAGSLGDDHQRRIGFPWSAALVERTLRSCGGSLAAARDAVCNGLAVHLAGGTHHARADRGAGYCVFNDVALAARAVQREAGWRKVLIVDLDVHQGDGTAAIFAGDPEVFTFSVHGEQNFPAAKAASGLDVALPRAVGDDAYLAAVTAGLSQALAASRPQFVCYLSGADPCVGDRLGTLQISKAALRERDRRVFAACRERRLPVVTVMGGGYGRDLADTVDVYEGTVREALASWQSW